ncbi:MAG TPA: hypothetical protein VFA78_05860, partial [Chloroflexota bacterium]|nr:hypothetical protein [Chloroflexota bacterium]
MEDWQQWQIRADAVAAELRQEVDELEARYLASDEEQNLRGFWPRFRALKEKVRVAPAIRLEDKLELERRLRGIGSRGYRAQEAAQARSTEDRTALLEEIGALRESAQEADSPRRLREL